jgi:hypothetical protein
MLHLSALFAKQCDEYTNYVKSIKDNVAMYKSSPQTYKENNNFLVLVPEVDGRKIVYVIDKQNKTQDNISSFYLDNLEQIKISSLTTGTTNAGETMLYVLFISLLISFLYHYIYKNFEKAALIWPCYFMIPIVFSAIFVRMFGFNEIVCELIIIIVYLSYTVSILKPNSVCLDE